MKRKSVIVIGGGAAGMMAAIQAAKHGNQVILLEKNEKLGKKLFITGKGRCNLTNACDLEELFPNIVTNHKFLYSAVYGFDNHQVMEYFEELGLPLKVERGNRVFPVSDHSSDVIRVLQQELKRLQVQVYLNTEVAGILTQELNSEPTGILTEELDLEPAGILTEELDSEPTGILTQELNSKECEQIATTEHEIEQADTAEGEQNSKIKHKRESKKESKKKKGQDKKVTGVQLRNGKKLSCDAVILATGGLSYPSTGSTGDGYRFALACGHTVKECHPSLVPLEARESWCKELMGLTLKNVAVTLMYENQKLYEGFGEVLFTHFGVSGPLILSASSYIGTHNNQPLDLWIDLKPALSEEQLDQRIQKDFLRYQNRKLLHALDDLLPKKLIPYVIAASGISEEKRVNVISKQERQNLILSLKRFPLHITGTRDYKEAIITKGGIPVKELQPQTMESKLVSGLYFAGEIIDVDAVTGGFNLQIAWSTGYAAGNAAAE